MMKTRRCGIYCRISRDDQGEGLGVARQEQACRELAARLGWKVVDVYVDNSVSAYDRRKKRPEYERMLSDLADEHIDAVLSWAIDRLTRHPAELERLIDVFQSTEAAVRTVVGGEHDIATQEGQFTLRLMGNIARLESGRKAERLKARNAQARVQGKRVNGGPRPFGYDRIYEGDGTARKIKEHVVNEAEAAIVRELAERALGGESVYSLCGDLNKRGITTTRGNAWTIPSLRLMLASGRLAGRLEHNRQVLDIEAPWDPIISFEDHQSLRRLLSYPGQGNGVRKSLKYMLSGMVWCTCGTKMRTQTARKTPRNPRPGRIFSCLPKAVGGCGGRVIGIAQLEELMTKLVFARLEEIEDAPQEDEAALKDLEGKVARWEAKLEELADEYEDGDMSAREMRQAGDRIREKIAEAEKEIAELGVRHRIGISSAELRKAWESEDFGLDRRRSIMSSLVERIEIGPHTGNRAVFDPSRVRITWKGQTA